MQHATVSTGSAQAQSRGLREGVWQGGQGGGELSLLAELVTLAVSQVEMSRLNSMLTLSKAARTPRAAGVSGCRHRRSGVGGVR